VSSEELLEKARTMIIKEGKQGWKLAEETLTKGKRSAQLTEAINYTMVQPDFLRPAVVSLCTQALGGVLEDTIPCGASLILFGKALGIHDDIIDNLKARKKRLTVFGKFGKEIALILSDVLCYKGFTLIRKNMEIGISEQKIMEILGTIDQTWFEQSEGEVLEVGSRKRVDVSAKQCLNKIKMRASEMEAIARIGGILGNGSEKEIRNLGQYGRLLGTASLLRDELIDMLEIDVLRHRIRNESLPLPIIFAVEDANAKTKITSIMAQKRLTNASLWKISKTSDDAGGMNHVRKLIGRIIEEAALCIQPIENRTEELFLLICSLQIGQKDWKLVLQSKCTSSKFL
jgi:geranylgeranyl pyrophosphate synthase